MNLPSKGRGLWRKEFYSFHSSHSAMDEDVHHEFGTWRNVWVGKVSGFVYGRWPKFWVWSVNLPPFHRRWLRRMKVFFPNIQ